MWSVWLFFCDCGFQSVCPLMNKVKRLMETSWWERLWGNLGFVLMNVVTKSQTRLTNWTEMNWKQKKYCCCSVYQLCPTLCDPMDCSRPSFSVFNHLLEFSQTHVHCVGDATQPSHPLSSPSPLAFNLSQHQGLFQWVSSSQQVAKVLEFQLQHQSF